MRTAKVDDIFVLLTPSPTLTSIDFPWQTGWQAIYGGVLTEPLHVSLQRFVCTDKQQLTKLIRALHIATSILSPIRLKGVDVRPLYSAFRTKSILKCRVQRTAALETLDELIRQTVLTYELTPHYRNLAVLVTVLEDIAKPTVLEPQKLPAPLPLFIGSHLVVSRVIGQELYEVIDEWELI